MPEHSYHPLTQENASCALPFGSPSPLDLSLRRRSALVGVTVRHRLAAAGQTRFDKDTGTLCKRVTTEVTRQAASDHTLIKGFCEGNELVEHVTIAVDNGDLAERRLSFAARVKSEKIAFGVDDLVVALDRTEVIGASPPSLLALRSAELAQVLSGSRDDFSIRTVHSAAIVNRCTRTSRQGHVVAMVAARLPKARRPTLGTCVYHANYQMQVATPCPLISWCRRPNWSEISPK